MSLVESDFVLIRTAVPVADASKVRDAMGVAGAGQQGNYAYCSGSYASVGRFLPLSGADPAIGKVGESQKVKEEIIEMLCRKNLVEKVVAALRASHPYEEPPIDILARYEIK